MHRTLSVLSTMAAFAAADDLLIHTPMLMVHDSATGYITEKNIVNDWAKTQDRDFYGQLSCGARTVDLRPKMGSDGVLIMHHGDVAVNKPFADALQDVVRFLKENPEELVVFFPTDCQNAAGAPDCSQAVRDAFTAVGAKVYTGEDCGTLQTLLYSEAKAAGELPTGGSLISVEGCYTDNYDPSLTCYNHKASEAEASGTTCYGSQEYHDGAFNLMYKYLNSTTQAFSPTGFNKHQALWQEDAAGVIIGTLQGSSLIQDEVRSDLNNEVLNRIQEGWFPAINILEVNNVCDHGNELLAALNARKK